MKKKKTCGMAAGWSNRESSAGGGRWTIDANVHAIIQVRKIQALLRRREISVFYEQNEQNPTALR
jgi:hypothetical protein